MKSEGKREVNCSLLDYYAAINGNFLPTFLKNPSIPNTGFKNPLLAAIAVLSYFAAET
jgi:hypothetical protein